MLSRVVILESEDFHVLLPHLTVVSVTLMDAHQHIQVKRSPRQQRRRRTLAWLDPAESCKGGSKGAMLGGSKEC